MGEEMADSILRTTCNFHDKCTDLLHAAKLRHGTDSFTSPPKEGMLKAAGLLVTFKTLDSYKRQLCVLEM
jgi:hypothetical protein